jgi:hypothetical protein
MEKAQHHLGLSSFAALPDPVLVNSGLPNPILTQVSAWHVLSRLGGVSNTALLL